MILRWYVSVKLREKNGFETEEEGDFYDSQEEAVKDAGRIASQTSEPGGMIRLTSSLYVRADMIETVYVKARHYHEETD